MVIGKAVQIHAILIVSMQYMIGLLHISMAYCNLKRALSHLKGWLTCRHADPRSSHDVLLDKPELQRAGTQPLYQTAL